MIDSHFHIWQLARGDYGWLTPALAPIYRDVGVTDWQVHASAAGVRRGILVQAAPSAAETDFLLAQAELHEEQVLGVVGWADLAADDAVERIAALARHPKLLGLRPMLQDIADPDWIVQPSVLRALAALPGHDLSFDALIKPEHLPRIERLAAALPALRIVIDHGAKPDISAGAFEPWASALQQLAAHGNVHCKLSGLVTESGQPPSLAACAPYVMHILDCFPGRVLWGSDWPVLELAGAELAGNYAGWLAFCRERVAQHGNDANDVFHHAALRAYGLVQHG